MLGLFQLMSIAVKTNGILSYDYCDGTWSGPLLTRTDTDKKLIMITDLLGRPAKENKNQLLFYIYTDGTVERKLIKQ